MSCDPIYDGVKEGFGLYTYCRNNPLIYHDPSGLSVIDDAKKVISKVWSFITGGNKGDKGNTKVTGRNNSANKSNNTTVKKDPAVNAKIDSSVKRYGDSEEKGMNYSTKDVADTIKEAAEEYKKQTGYDMFVGDASLEGGVESDRHRSSDGKVWDHKGWSVDLKPGTSDGTNMVGMSYDDKDSKYSSDNTVTMIDTMKSIAEKHNLTLNYVIFADEKVYDSEKLKGTRFLSGDSLLNIHKNHIHIEFKSK